MPYKNVEDRRRNAIRRDRYLRTLPPESINGNKVINCSCGCGEKFWEMDHTKRKRKYIPGHNAYNKKGNEAFAWNGGTTIKKGYKYQYFPSHPHATKDGYVLEHRLVMEFKIGRILNKNEVVHHKDKNRLNNSIDNLELVVGSGKHLMKFHNVRDIKTGKFIHE